MKRLFISDCEGPISKNDNAYELAQNFIPNGDKLFVNISRYDDVLADILHKPEYSAGATLKLILPFFKAYGVTDGQMNGYSTQNIVLIPDSQITLKHVQRLAHTFIVSTSYEHYIRALCKATAFPFHNTYCTRVSLDKTAVTPQEKEHLREVAQEIAEMPRIKISKGAKAMEDFSQSDQALIQRLDEVFWSLIPKMFVGKFLVDVTTVGGEQKAEAVRTAVKRSGADLADVMYVGDSITDAEAFKLVRSNGGLTLSFNGNGYAVRTAETAVLSESSLVTAAIADVFSRFGREKALSVIEDWSFRALKEGDVDASLLGKLAKLYPDALPKAKIVTPQIMESLAKESSEFRGKVRGEVGRLG